MKTRDVIGRRVVAVRQERRRTREMYNRTAEDVSALVLDNGVEIVPTAVETDFGEYYVEMTAHRPTTPFKRTRGVTVSRGQHTLELTPAEWEALRKAANNIAAGELEGIMHERLWPALHAAVEKLNWSKV